LYGKQDLYHAIREGELPDTYEASLNTDQMLSPYRGRGLGKWKDSFYFWLSHSRQSIERAFGMLTMRFGIFWRKFRFAYERWSLVIIVCMKLHDLCLHRMVTMPQHRFNEDIELDDRYIVYDNNDEDEDTLLRNRAIGDRRNNITVRLESEGRLRPLYASSNSRQ
jgi:hypothetical protein